MRGCVVFRCRYDQDGLLTFIIKAGIGHFAGGRVCVC